MENVFSKFQNLQKIDVTNVEVLKSEYEKLLNFEIKTMEDLYEFNNQRDIIDKHIENKWCENYFLMTTDVADEQKKKDNDFFDEVISPISTEYGDKLDQKFLSCPLIDQLGDEFDIYKKNLKSKAEIFCTENIEVQKKIDKICSEITEIQGKQTVMWDGKESPLQQVYPEYKSTDRERRKKAFEAVITADLKVCEEIDNRFEKLLSLRHELAKNAKVESYTKYVFKEMQRFDWDESHCFEFHKAVKKYILPLRDKQLERRKKNLNLEVLRPYDLSVDEFDREPLFIYDKDKVNEFIDGAGKIIKAIDEELYTYFKDIRDNNLLDLVARENKAPGGFMLMYPVFEKASVFYGGVGIATDLSVLLHELGHCFHYYLGKDVKPYALQNWCAEVAESGSTSMEFIGLEHANEYLPEDQCKRVKEDRLKSVIGLLVDCAKIDEFQHWIYANPGHSKDQRQDKWKELTREYDGNVDMSGYEDDCAKTDWQFVHILQMPFYYIDYAISEILALSVWDKYKKDPKLGLKYYKDGCSLAASKSVPEIYEAFGTNLSFGEDVVKPLASRLSKELGLEG